MVVVYIPSMWLSHPGNFSPDTLSCRGGPVGIHATCGQGALQRVPQLLCYPGHPHRLCVPGHRETDC